jgi:uncharacterized protein (DUF362 family)/Pyruvate/2-oxoacid:ferredoxin oxidoreductase delta subunit
MDTKVYIVRCPNYDEAGEKMSELFSLMGGMAKFCAQKERIVLKVNLLRRAKPEEAVSTHPTVVTAVARLAKNEGAIPIIVDSPGTGYKYDKKTLDTLYSTCEMFKVAEETGIEVNFDTTYRSVSFPEGKLIKRFEVITPVLQANGVFNLCKFKTHSFMAFTGAVKNNFGVIPGLHKPGYHAKLHDTERFADMLLDLAGYVSPRISIMDAVFGMEGNGPGAGTPRKIGLLLGSINPLALDLVASEIIGLPRERNPILVAAEKRSLSPTRLEEVQIIGPNISEMRILDYKFPSTLSGGMGIGDATWLQRLATRVFKNDMSMKPWIVTDKCIACGVCRDSCPMKAISVIQRKGEYAHINYKHCIRCYCCHELCGERAIELKESFLYHRVMKI